MTMKTMLTFILGAVLAAAVVYVAVGRRPAPPDPVVYQTTAPVKSATDPATPAAAPEPAEAPPPVAEPAPVEHRAAARAERRPTQHPVASAKPSALGKPVQKEPVKVAENRPQTMPETPHENPVPAAATAPQIPPPLQSAPPQIIEERKPERVPQTVTIPAGTLITVRTDQALSSETSNAGDNFRATLDAPLVVDNAVIAERGARVQGRVVEVDRGGRVSGVAKMTLELTTVTTSDGQRIRVQTAAFARNAEQSRGRDAAKVGAAACIGAAIGAIAGGGKGAAIGAVVGGAAGTGGVMATRGKAAELPAETRVSFRLEQPVTVTEKLK